MNNPPSAFFDFPQRAFPFEITVMDEESLEVLWHVAVTGPGALHVPSFAPRKVSVLMVGATGERSVTDSGGHSIALPGAGPDGDQHGQ